MNKKVVLAGGTGFIGEFFEKRFKDLGYDVLIISRQSPHINWSDQAGIVQSMEHADMLINLAGKSVDCRYNSKNKEEILTSRISTTKILGTAILKCENPPPLWINSSSATIYRHAEDRPMTEEEGEIGTGFSVDVAREWENTLFSFHLPQTRQVALRIAIVLGESGGVMTPFKNLVKFGLGGVQGSGKQMFSWIHIEDLFEIVLFLKDKQQLRGVFNCSAPNPITNRELMNHLREEMNRKLGIPSPTWMLEIGAVFIRTETELILKSRWVVPERLQKAGFTFKYNKIEEALHQVLKN